MTKQPFPITNNSAHHFTSCEYAALAQYITTRTTDEILRAEITDTEIKAYTHCYGFHAFKLIDVFPPHNKGITRFALALLTREQRLTSSEF